MVADPARIAAHVGVLLAAVVALGALHPGVGGWALSGSEREPVVLVAAASLAVVADELEAAFEAAHPEVDLQISLGGSAVLREQVLDGIPADVLVTANTETMADVVEADLVVGAATVLVENRVVLAVPAAVGVGLADGGADALDRVRASDPLVGLCEPAVPCGGAAAQFLQELSWPVEPATLEPDVRSVVAKLEAGELDAGVVYRTDVDASDGRLVAVPTPAGASVGTSYPAAMLQQGPNEAGARLLLNFLMSEQGREIFGRRGFGQP